MNQTKKQTDKQTKKKKKTKKFKTKHTTNACLEPPSRSIDQSITLRRSLRASAEEAPFPPFLAEGSLDEPFGLEAFFMVSIRTSFSFSSSPIFPTRASNRSLHGKREGGHAKGGKSLKMSHGLGGGGFSLALLRHVFSYSFWGCCCRSKQFSVFVRFRVGKNDHALFVETHIKS